ncbi:MAG: metallophosphoesterase, partial [Abditibacteriota bacterium]|nr:metallophosphoesterase [Abditibacteriota bacterium]
MKKLIFIIILAAAAACARCADKTVAELNPDFEPAMVAALKSDVPCFSLLHFSDIHSDASEFARLCEFYGTYEKYFDGAVCTGDLIEASLLSDFTYWAKTPGHEKVMIAIGNHDTLRDHKNWEPNVWDNQMTMKESYDYYMKPFIKGWNVIYEEGKTYYFKDYT